MCASYNGLIFIDLIFIVIQFLNLTCCLQNDLWKKVKDYPLSSFLSDKSSYIFKSITQDAEQEEFYDETRR